MEDLQARLEKLRTDAEDCALIGKLATDAGSKHAIGVLARVNFLRPARRVENHMRDSVAGGASFECLITGDAHLRRLNLEFRGKDYATDVLSLPLSQSSSRARMAMRLGFRAVDSRVKDDTTYYYVVAYYVKPLKAGKPAISDASNEAIANTAKPDPTASTFPPCHP